MIRQRVLVLALILATWATPVLANGRFPKTSNVHIQPGNDQVIMLAATFGLLISRDGGTSFQWVCEEAIGYGGAYDPDYAIATDGSIFATTFEGLRVSRDGGCTWVNAGQLSAEEYFAEVEIGPNGEIWAATASATLPNHVYLSEDNGETFAPRDNGLPQVWWKSLRIAPSDPQRLYVSGYRVAEMTGDGGLVPPTAVAFRSDDGGLSWNEISLAPIEFGTEPWFFISAISRDDPNVIYGRSQGANTAIGDILYRSDDGGDTWSESLRTTAFMQSVLIRQSGTMMVGTLTDGVHRSFDGGLTWERQNLPQMCCLAENQQGTLYSCGANWEPDFFALGTSQDGENWEKVVRFSEIKDAYSCPAGTIQNDTCVAKRWPALCEMFGCNAVATDAGSIDAPGSPPSSGGCCSADTGVAGSSLFFGFLVVASLAWRRRRLRIGAESGR